MARSDTDRPSPGDLFLDEGVPVIERVTLVRNGWRASATHIWAGAGWIKLGPRPVHVVPRTPVPPVPPRRSLARPAALARQPAATPGALPEPLPAGEDVAGGAREPSRLLRSVRRPPG